MRKLFIIFVFSMILGIAGCASLKKETIGQFEADFDSMEEEVQFSYEVPVSTPGIIVDQLGYRTRSAKGVIFQGREIPDYFQVIDENSGEVVFTGISENKEWNKANRRI